MNPRHFPKEPWDASWELREDRRWEARDPLGLPPISWGSPRLVREATYDRLHQLNGTWTRGLGNPWSRGSSFHSLADLESSEVVTDPPTASPGVEPVGHLSSPAVSNRPIVRPGTPARPPRLTRRRTQWLGWISTCSHLYFSVRSASVVTSSVDTSHSCFWGNRVEYHVRISTDWGNHSRWLRGLCPGGRQPNETERTSSGPSRTPWRQDPKSWLSAWSFNRRMS